MKKSRFNRKFVSSLQKNWILFATFFCIFFIQHSVFGTSGIKIKPHALLETGHVATGKWLLPNGRMIKPAGRQPGIDSLPLGMVLSPDGKFIFVTNGGAGTQSISVIDTEKGEVVQVVEEDALYLGIAMSPDGKTLYASGGGAGIILVYDFTGQRLELRAKWQARGLPGGMCVSSDGRYLYYVSRTPKQVHVMDTGTGGFLESSFTGNDPYTVVANPVKKEIYVSCEGDNEVAAFDVSIPAWIRRAGCVKTGKNPEGMTVTPNGRYLFVANSDDDSFTIIDLDKMKVAATMDLRPYIQKAYGTAPNAVAFSPEGKRVYIAQASDNKIAVISVPDGKFIGSIQTAWYPTAILLNDDGKKIYIANGKGTGTSPSSPTTSLVNRGTVQLLDMPDDKTLRVMADSTETFNRLPGDLFEVDTLNFKSPVPLRRGMPSQIKYVIFIVRENKTYDAIIGDWEKGNGDPSKCIYCYEETPNLHALARRFGSCDNYYSNAEISTQGHELTTAAITNPYVEKQWAMRDRTIPLEADVFINPATYPKNDFIFQNALRSDVSFRDYGEAVGVGKDLMIFDPRYVHWGIFDPPVFWMFSRDMNKLNERILEWTLFGLPHLVYMLFPDDHTFGYEWPFPSPESMVADNDLATGKFVEWLSHSKYWEQSAVFIIEDDPQQGEDHVDNHRSIMLIASPWVNREYVSHVHYSEANIHATIQHILNMPPLTIYDEIAQPMWDIFTNEPDFTPYDAVESRVNYSYNLPGTEYGKQSRGLNFLEPDEANGLPGMVKDYQKDVIRAKKERQELEKISKRTPFVWKEILQKLEDENSSDYVFTSMTETSGGQVDLNSVFCKETLKLFEDYRIISEELNVTVLPENPLETFLAQLKAEVMKYEIIRENGLAVLSLDYRNGLKGEIKLVREDNLWKIDLCSELGNAVRMMTDAKERLNTIKEARDNNKPVMNLDDD